MDIKLFPDHIKDIPSDHHWGIPASALPMLADIEASGACVYTGELSCDITALFEYGRIKVKGSVAVPVEMQCARCLCSYETFLRSAFTIYYTKGRPEQFSETDEVELASEDLVSAYYSGDEIDLSHEVAEQVAMSLPLKPVCNEECRGLCQECGINLNNASCECSSGTPENPFSVLKNFRIKR